MSDPPTKLELAEKSFNVVLRHTEHEDEKANRLLISMTFLTAAVAAAFTRIFDPSTNPMESISGRDVNLTALLFIIFLGLVVLGTLFMLAALGPKFTLLPAWRRQHNAWNQDSSSFLFAEVIARHSIEAWQDRWSKDADDISGEFQDHYVKETFLLARAAAFKVQLMSIGREFYRFALLFLMLFLIVTLVSPLSIAVAACGVPAALWLLQTSWEFGAEPGHYSGNTITGFKDTPARALYSIVTFAAGVALLAGSVILLACRL